MIRKIALISLWFALTPTILILIGVFFVLQKNNLKPLSVNAAFNVTAAEPEVNNIQGEVVATKINDARPFVLEKFLRGTPLKPYSRQMVEVADKYGIDYRFIPAIAMKESGGGSVIPNNSFNAWGFENGRTHFTSWEQAIDNVGQTLKTRYIDKGYTTPDQIMPIYAPPAVENGGGWARDINTFFAQMDTL